MALSQVAEGTLTCVSVNDINLHLPSTDSWRLRIGGQDNCRRKLKFEEWELTTSPFHMGNWLIFEKTINGL